MNIWPVKQEKTDNEAGNPGLKVAAYARVSMDSARMQHSLKAQTEYYERMIRENQDWKFAGVYADAGISGTGTGRRQAFQEMMEDCEKGKIDKILVKSVSRFARNTVDLLQQIRRLKELEISVWFEEQQIDSLTEEGELLLTLMASLAQAESETISENAKWTIRKRFQKGIGNTRRRVFGYRWVDGRLTVVPEEAEAVKRIYENFLAGISHMRTVEELNRKGITTIQGNPFSVGAISTILRNITYTGDTLLQKTYIQDPILKKKRRNTGELPQYLVRNDHEAIIDRKTFERVQEQLAKNKEKGRFPYNCRKKTYPFTGKIICGHCGRHFTRQLWNTGKTGEKRATWICGGKKMETYRRCQAENLSEEKLMEVCSRVLGLKEFQEICFLREIESVTVYEKKKLIFRFQNGKEVKWQ